jgi:hypothetical protein
VTSQYLPLSVRCTRAKQIREQQQISPAELDRIGGGTHLISQLDSPPPTPPRAPVVLPSASDNIYSGASAFAANLQAAQLQHLQAQHERLNGPSSSAAAPLDMQMESPGDDVVMHPTVAEDMRGLYGAGSMGYNIFDFPPPSSGNGGSSDTILGRSPDSQQHSSSQTSRFDQSFRLEEDPLIMISSSGGIGSVGDGLTPPPAPANNGDDESTPSSSSVSATGASPQIGFGGPSSMNQLLQQQSHFHSNTSLPGADYYQQNGIGVGISPGGTFAVPTIPSTITGHSIFNPPSYPLDASWQSFVEQIGF